MRALLAILRLGLRSLRGGPPRLARAPALSVAVRLALVIALASASGAAAGVLPAVVGVVLGAVTGAASGQSAPPSGGLSLAIARVLATAAPLAAAAAALVATLVSVGVAVLSSRAGAELAGDLTAALRIELFRAALFASPRDVAAFGVAHAAGPPARPPAANAPAGAPRANAPPAPAPPAPAPPAPAPPARGAEVVKLAIARDAGLVADFAVALLTGLPQAVATLAILSAELVSGGMGVVLAGGCALFILSRLATVRASRRVALAMRDMQHADTAVFGALGESLAGAEDLRLVGARERSVREIAGASYRVADARRRFSQALAVSGQIKSVFLALAPVLIVAAIGIAGAGGRATPGDVGKLLLVVPLLMARLDALDALRAGFVERAPLLAATLSLLRLPEHPPPARSGERAAHPPGGARDPAAIAFERVSFAPPGCARPILDGVSLSIPAGAVVGVCGRSGCGKSTLVRLLLRLDEPSSGAIAIEGVDLQRIPPAALPRLFGVLGQSARLFERSVADNLALGLDPPPSEERMREALRRVELDAFAGAEAPPAGADASAAAGARGLATEIRATPPSVSGGEARRLLLARMLLREPRIFVLDEPEAGLPSATAEALLRTVGEEAAGRTAVVVTHAPHLLRSTFNVLLDEGRVVAVGSHEELASSSALYRSLLAEALQRPRGGARDPEAR